MKKILAYFKRKLLLTVEMDRLEQKLKEEQDWRFEWISLHLCNCRSLEELFAVQLMKDKLLVARDYSDPRFNDLMREIKMLEAYFMKDDAVMRQMRIDYGDHLLKQSGIS